MYVSTESNRQYNENKEIHRTVVKSLAHLPSTCPLISKFYSFVITISWTKLQKKGISTSVLFSCCTVRSLGGDVEALSQAEMPIHSSWQKTHKNCVWTISAGNGTRVKKSLHEKTSSSYSSVLSPSEILFSVSAALSSSLFPSFLLFFFLLYLDSLLCFPPSFLPHLLFSSSTFKRLLQLLPNVLEEARRGSSKLLG